jgi:CBS-domain-containing membrane protein
MVPLSEYATVPAGCTLREAVLALEKAQEEFDHTKYRHRAILILDGKNRVIGKLNHLDALRALIPEHDGNYGTDELGRFGFSNGFIRKLHQHRLQRTAPLTELCRNAGAFKVEDYMCAPAEDECIDHKSDLTTAIHQLVQENLRSLLVTRQGEITGILRLTDLFSAVYHTMAGRSDQP